jgi:hypothetical protein
MVNKDGNTDDITLSGKYQKSRGKGLLKNITIK